jgi:hemoglobin
MGERTLFEQMGGEPALRRVIDRFVDRVFEDTMIGFFFKRASRERIKQKEYELAAGHLGANVVYTGRPLAEAHAPHPIMGGQFDRRLQILKDTLDEFSVPEAVRAHWIDTTLSLRSLITRDAAGQCNDPLARVAETKP